MIFASEIWGAFFREGLLSGFYGMCLRALVETLNN